MAIHISKDGDIDDDNVPAEDLALINELKNYILSIYKPASIDEADTRMSTNEVFEAFCRIYHNEVLFSRNDLAKWLQQQGFKIWDAGVMRFEWLMKSGS